MDFLNRFISKVTPHRFFMASAAVFGLIFILVTPPFQTPDEFNHFYRAYQISEGNFVGISKDHRVGGDLPVSLVNSSKPFRFLLRKEYTSTDWATIKAQFAIPLNEKERVFVDFPNTGMYAFVSYIPQASGIFILRSFQLPPICIFYGGRLAALLFWIFSIGFIIRLLPFYQWLFTLLALLPMSVSTNSSMSADVMTNVLAFAVIAYSFHLAYRQPFVSTHHMIVFIILGLLLALAKVVYLPLILLVFLIPQEKFISQRVYYSQLLLLFIMSGSTALYWSSVMKGLYVPYQIYNPVALEDPMLWTSIVPCANMADQMQYILVQKWYYVPKVFAYSFVEAFDMYSQSYIGTFGWLDTFLPMSIIYMGYFCIFLVALWEGSTTFSLGQRFKPLLILSFVVTLILILFSQLLTWVCVGEGVIDIIQGRYLIPVMPLLFMLLQNRKWDRKQQAAVLVVMASLLMLICSATIIYERYLVRNEFEVITLRCNAEETVDDKFRTDTIALFLDNAATRSDEKARSGKYSVKISLKNPYTFTYRLVGCEQGDSLTIDVYRWGKNGGIIISDTENRFHTFVKDPIETDSSGWDHLQSKFMIPEKMREREIVMFGYYPEGNDSSYFDDIKIVYRKLK